MTDFQDWNSGVALVHAAVNQVNQGLTNLAGNGSQVIPSIAVTQLGLDIAFSGAQLAVLGANPFGQLLITWQDQASGQNTWFETITIPLGSAGLILCCVSLVAKGDLFLATVANKDPAQQMSFTLAITQHSRPATRDRGVQPLIAPVNGFNQPGGNPETGEHCNTSPSIGPSSSVSRLMPFSMGKHRMTTSNLAGLNAMSVAITDALSGDLIGKWSVPAGGADTRDFNLPSSPCQLTLANTQATNTIVPNFTSMREDY